MSLPVENLRLESRPATSPPPLAACAVCFFGMPSMGSWKIRAEQVATARLGWTSVADLDASAVIRHEAFCAVKKSFASRLRLLRDLGKATFFDVVDCWAQPADGLRYVDLPAIRAFFRSFVEGMPLDGVIFPNRTMLEDLGDLVPNPVTIYHHYWPGLQPIAVRERARIVGYEGEPAYLGPWRAAIERICRRHGLRFVVNPRDLRSIDIGIAARGGVHASTMSRRYKSNVKLANFYGGGIPCVVEDQEASYHETDHGEVRFFNDERQLEDRIVELLPLPVRQRVHEHFVGVRERYSLPVIAAEYDAYFSRVLGRRDGPRGRCYPAAPPELPSL
jgi:hypothetical protein